VENAAGGPNRLPDLPCPRRHERPRGSGEEDRGREGRVEAKPGSHGGRDAARSEATSAGCLPLRRGAPDRTPHRRPYTPSARHGPGRRTASDAPRRRPSVRSGQPSSEPCACHCGAKGLSGDGPSGGAVHARGRATRVRRGSGGCAAGADALAAVLPTCRQWQAIWGAPDQLLLSGFTAPRPWDGEDGAGRAAFPARMRREMRPSGAATARSPLDLGRVSFVDLPESSHVNAGNALIHSSGEPGFRCGLPPGSGDTRSRRGPGKANSPQPLR